MPTSNNCEVRQLLWHQLWPAAQPLMLDHHVERGFNAEYFKVDPIEQQSIELIGRSLIIGGFIRGQLAGYILWYISNQLGEADTQFAKMGPWYVEPKARRTRLGLMLFDLSVDLLRGRCKRLMYGTSQFAGWPHRRGARLYEVCWMMEL